MVTAGTACCNSNKLNFVPSEVQAEAEETAEHRQSNMIFHAEYRRSRGVDCTSPCLLYISMTNDGNFVVLSYSIILQYNYVLKYLLLFPGKYSGI